MQDKPLDGTGAGSEDLSVAERMARALDAGAEWAFNRAAHRYAYTAGWLSLLATLLRRGLVTATYVPPLDGISLPWSYAMKIAEVHGFDVAEKRFQVRQ